MPRFIKHMGNIFTTYFCSDTALLPPFIFRNFPCGEKRLQILEYYGSCSFRSRRDTSNFLMYPAVHRAYDEKVDDQSVNVVMSVGCR